MLSSIPTPSNSVIGIGPLTIHYYALCIILGVAAAIWLGDKRFRRFASNSPQSIGVVADVAIYAVPAGIIGGRIYHVITSPAQYFGANGRPLDARPATWEGAHFCAPRCVSRRFPRRRARVSRAVSFACR